jgi:hypothetical protein
VGAGIGVVMASWANLLPPTDPLKSFLIIAAPVAAIVCQGLTDGGLKMFRDFDERRTYREREKRRVLREQMALDKLNTRINEIELVLQRSDLDSSVHSSLEKERDLYYELRSATTRRQIEALIQTEPEAHPTLAGPRTGR